jgi:hypothetical protein
LTFLARNLKGCFTTQENFFLRSALSPLKPRA